MDGECLRGNIVRQEPDLSEKRVVIGTVELRFFSYLAFKRRHVKVKVEHFQ